MDHQQKRPAGITALCLFFVFGTLASGLAGLMVLFRGTWLDVLWGLNPRARQSLLGMGNRAVFLMCAVSLASALAALGLWRCRRWGYWTAAAILSINLLGDTVNAFFLHDWRTLIGLPIGGLMIGYLFGKRRIFK